MVKNVGNQHIDYFKFWNENYVFIEEIHLISIKFKLKSNIT